MLGDVCTPGELPMSQTKGFSIIIKSQREESSIPTHWRNANDRSAVESATHLKMQVGISMTDNPSVGGLWLLTGQLG